MTEKEIFFKNKNGLHARPSARVSEIANEYKECRTFLIFNGNEINAKSILNLIIHAIPGGSHIRIRSEGEREEEVVEALYEYLSGDNLGIEKS